MSIRSTLLGVAAVRLATLPLTIGGTLASAWIVSHDVGLQEFGRISLVTTVVLLLPFADLGLSAAVVNAVARNDQGRDRIIVVARTLLAAIALAWISAVTVVHHAVGWDDVFGTPVDDKLVSGCLILFATAIPFGVGYRMMVGSGDVARASALQAAYPITMICVTLSGYASSTPAIYYLAPSAAQLVTATLTYAAAVRRLRPAAECGPICWGTRTELRTLLRQGWPMLVVSVGLASALQSHRLILSHFGTPRDVADFSIAMAFYAPAWGLAGTVGMQLWSHFVTARQSDLLDARVEFKRRLVEFIALGLALAAVLSLMGPILASLIFGRAVPLALWLALSALIAIQCLHLPSGMFLTGSRDLSLQALQVGGMAVSTVALAMYLTPHLGLPGPVVASAASILVLQVPGGFLAVRRRLRSELSVPGA